MVRQLWHGRCSLSRRDPNPTLSHPTIPPHQGRERSRPSAHLESLTVQVPHPGAVDHSAGPGVPLAGASISDLARALGLDRSYVSRIMRLSLLSPDIVEAIVSGNEPSGLSLERLVKKIPMLWKEQRGRLAR